MAPSPKRRPRQTASEDPSPAGLLKVIGREGAWQIWSAAAAAPCRFKDFQRVCEATDTTISARLTELGEWNILSRSVTDSKPPGTLYEATESGRVLKTAIERAAAAKSKPLERKRERRSKS